MQRIHLAKRAPVFVADGGRVQGNHAIYKPFYTLLLARFGP